MNARPSNLISRLCFLMWIAVGGVVVFAGGGHGKHEHHHHHDHHVMGHADHSDRGAGHGHCSDSGHHHHQHAEPVAAPCGDGVCEDHAFGHIDAAHDHCCCCNHRGGPMAAALILSRPQERERSEWAAAAPARGPLTGVAYPAAVDRRPPRASPRPLDHLLHLRTVVLLT